MKASLRALLEGILDYAGMFPPAKLPLEKAIANYAEYLEGDHAWMLSNFICPVEQLEALVPHLPLFEKLGLLELAVLGKGGLTDEEYLNQLAQDIETLATFQKAHKGQVSVLVYESPLPPSQKIPELLVKVDKLWEDSGLDLTVYHETKLTEDWVSAIEAISGQPQRGFKLRCGGVTKQAFPLASDVATIVKFCQAMQVPLKFTAGLHHPLPRYDEVIGTPMQGFINLFGGAILAKQLDRNDTWMLSVLNEFDAQDFNFTDEEFTLWDQRIPTAQISEMRQNVVTSFGSCSFEGPKEDLQRLGWL